jgi:uncharacterized protein
MSTETSRFPEINTVRAGPWWEIILVMAVYLAVRFLIPSLAQVLAVPLILYMVIESWLRHRSWADNGFNLRTILSGLRKTFGLLLLVVVVLQIGPIYGEHILLPELSAHIINRVPYDLSNLGPGFFIFLAVSTFLEEVIFRALFQNRLSAFVSPAVAIITVSLVFASGHIQPGPMMVVLADFLGVFVDSLLFGIIYQQSKNVFVAWIPHYLADIVATFILLSLK